jgi:hypothetical protein
MAKNTNEYNSELSTDGIMINVCWVFGMILGSCEGNVSDGSERNNVCMKSVHNTLLVFEECASAPKLSMLLAWIHEYGHEENTTEEELKRSRGASCGDEGGEYIDKVEAIRQIGGSQSLSPVCYSAELFCESSCRRGKFILIVGKKLTLVLNIGQFGSLKCVCHARRSSGGKTTP